MHLWAEVLNDSHANLVARRGQAQQGVDVWGYRDGDTNCIVGIQCKKKATTNLTASQVTVEVNKAKQFKPGLSELIIVTTASDDGPLQEHVRVINETLCSEGYKLKVHVYGWRKLEKLIHDHPSTIKYFDPCYSASQVALANDIAAIKTDIAEIASSSVKTEGIALQFEKIREMLSNSQVEIHRNEIKTALDEEYLHTIASFKSQIGSGGSAIIIGPLSNFYERIKGKCSKSVSTEALLVLGLASMNNNQKSQAYDYFMLAAHETDDRQLSLHYKISAKFIGQQWNDLLLFGQIAKEEGMIDPHMASLLVRASGHLGRDIDPNFFPEKIWEDYAVRVAVADHRRNCNPDGWLEESRKLVCERPDDKAAESLFCQAVAFDVSRVLVSKVKPQSTPEEQQKVFDILNLRWKKIQTDGYPYSGPEPFIVEHLAFMQSHFGEFSALGQTARDALSHYEDEHMGELLAKIIYFTQSELFTELQSGFPATARVRSYTYRNYLNTGKWRELSQITDEDLMSLTVEDRPLFSLCRDLGDILEMGLPVPVNQLRDAVKNAQSDILMSIVAAEVCHSLAEKELSELSYQNALALLDNKTHVIDRVTLSMAASRQCRWDDILEILDQNHTLYDLDTARLVAEACFRTNNANDNLIDRLELLSNSEFYGDWQVQRSLGSAYFKIGRFNEALELFERLWQGMKDISDLRMLLKCLKSLGQSRELDNRQSFEGMGQINGNPEGFLRHAAEMMENGHSELALEIAYAVGCQFYPESKLVAGLAHSILWRGKEMELYREPANVTENVGVHLLDEKDQILFFFIGGSRAPDGVETLNPRNPLFKALEGHPTHSVIPYPIGRGDMKSTTRILEITHRYTVLTRAIVAYYTGGDEL